MQLAIILLRVQCISMRYYCNILSRIIKQQLSLRCAPVWNRFSSRYLSIVPEGQVILGYRGHQVGCYRYILNLF